MFEEWGNAVLQDLVTFQKGRKVDVLDYPHEGYEPYLGAGVLAGDPVENYAYPSGGVVAEPTDVLMLWDGERSGLVGTGKAGVVSSTVAKLSPNQKIDGKYLYYFLSDRFEWIQGRRTGTGVPHVPKDLGKILQVKFPRDIESQQKIAKILSTLDEAIEQTEALIEKTKKIKAGLMQDLFTRGVLPNGQLRPPRNQAPHLYKDSPLGWIPGEWEVFTLVECSQTLIDGPFGSNLKTEDYVDNQDGCRVVRLQNIGVGIYDDSEKAYISCRKAKSLDKHEVLSGDVLIAALGDERSPAGRSCTYPKDFPPAINKADCFRFRSNEALTSNAFISHSLNSKKSNQQTKKYVQGVTLQRINLGNLRRILIPIPSKSEQDYICASLEKTEETIQGLDLDSLNLGRIKSGLMHDLLSSRFPIPLDKPKPIKDTSVS
jgi:type I restriction enzyme S subunit